MHYWLLKTEPSTFSIDDLINAASQKTAWDGVRNYQARNFLRMMKKDDLAFFYHSSCAVPGIVAITRICKESCTDLTAFDAKSPYFDPQSTSNNPRWFAVEVELIRTLKKTITLKDIKANPKLTDLPLVRKGNRLSVMPITPLQWDNLLAME